MKTKIISEGHYSRNERPLPLHEYIGRILRKYVKNDKAMHTFSLALQGHLKRDHTYKEGDLTVLWKQETRAITLQWEPTAPIQVLYDKTWCTSEAQALIEYLQWQHRLPEMVISVHNWCTVESAFLIEYIKCHQRLPENEIPDDRSITKKQLLVCHITMEPSEFSIDYTSHFDINEEDSHPYTRRTIIIHTFNEKGRVDVPPPQLRGMAYDEPIQNNIDFYLSQQLGHIDLNVPECVKKTRTDIPAYDEDGKTNFERDAYTDTHVGRYKIADEPSYETTHVGFWKIDD